MPPTVYGGNRSFHRSREVNKFIVGEGFPLPPFVSFKPFATADDRWSPLRCTVVTVCSTALRCNPIITQIGRENNISAEICSYHFASQEIFTYGESPESFCGDPFCINGEVFRALCNNRIDVVGLCEFLVKIPAFELLTGLLAGDILDPARGNRKRLAVIYRDFLVVLSSSPNWLNCTTSSSVIPLAISVNI